MTRNFYGSGQGHDQEGNSQLVKTRAIQWHKLSEERLHNVDATREPLQGEQGRCGVKQEGTAPGSRRDGGARGLQSGMVKESVGGASRCMRRGGEVGNVVRWRWECLRRQPGTDQAIQRIRCPSPSFSEQQHAATLDAGLERTLRRCDEGAARRDGCRYRYLCIERPNESKQAINIRIETCYRRNVRL